MKLRHYTLFNIVLLVLTIVAIGWVGMRAQNIYDNWGDTATIPSHLLHPENEHIERIVTEIQIENLRVDYINPVSSTLPDGISYQIYGSYELNDRSQDFSFTNRNIRDQTIIYYEDERGDIISTSTESWLAQTKVIRTLSSGNTAILTLNGIQTDTEYIINSIYVDV